jgi:mono/diheme cytochrome c family protein
LGGGLLMGKLNKPPLNLPTFSTNRYDPLVGASWPQNNYSMAGKLVPDACGSCHEKDGAGGRFPLLSTDLKSGYCAILARAIEKTMPPSKPGSLQNDAEIKAFLTHCDDAPNSANADPDP